ncbi:MAG: hypothetical protein UY48_C0011G0004 [Candidatus Gottesmanbacteria bacterium GW2011_GWB1_49_7]|uniref:Uncharacterized protein n=1 Tax=Candidatus Gottesmanbacteria bacterium GW2011_GWB1_49_7 TaxID=1618448 RepID=A0A0G1YC62_9BACT|nr:MAG: hypothetical protein UY48_C0011G0004 [Candidatus Gottesmanbacteria bacterium GW2011_GWB1_49_7]
MTLSIFDLNVGKKMSGFKLAAGDITTVNDNITIATGLSGITGATFGIVGSNTVTGRIVSRSGGNIVISLTSYAVSTTTSIISYPAVTVLYTISANIIGY